MGHASPQAALIYQHATSSATGLLPKPCRIWRPVRRSCRYTARPKDRERDLTPRQLGHVQVTPASEAAVKETELGLDQDFLEHPQRDSNPCCRLERAVS